MLIAALLCGVVIGIASGMLGVGGGTLMVPLFRLAFGMQAVAATATSLFTIIPTSLAGLITHLRNKTCVVRVGLITGLAGACASPVGVMCANWSPGWVVMAAAAAIIIYSAVTMYKKAMELPKPEKQHKAYDKPREQEEDAQNRIQKHTQEQPQEGPRGCDKGPVDLSARTCTDGRSKADGSSSASATSSTTSSKTSRALTAKTILILVGIGLLAGFCSGFVGVGGGFLMVPMFIAFAGLSMKQAAGTSLVGVLILAIPGVVTQGLLGNIGYMAGIAMACGTIPGAVLGAVLIKHVPERSLRLFFAGFLLFAAVVLLGNEIINL